jgi:anti-anti-sigma factor
MATAPILRENLAPFEGNGVSRIILDLRALTFINSTGLHALLEARSRSVSFDRLLLSGASPVARRLMELTGTLFLLDNTEGFSGNETATTEQMLG